jgi:hypothetical protein
MTDLPQWAVSAWVKSPEPPADNKPSGPVHREGNYQFSWNHGDPNFRGAAAVRVQRKWHAATFGPLEGNRWYHLAATYDGETLKSYKDGVLVTASEDPSGPPDVEPASLKIGRHALGEEYFTGSVRDVRLYSRPLSAEEIKALFEGRDIAPRK